MGPRNSKQAKNSFMNDYDVIQRNQAQNLTYLQHKKTEQQYLLRQFNFNDKKQCDKTLEKLSELKNKLSGNKHVAPLKDYLTSSEDQYCSTFYKIYALFQYPQRTLDDQINQRNLQKRKFSETQLWSILASCILGMSHLQKNGIKHSALKSSNILLSQQGIIKVADPFSTGIQSNYQTCLTKRTTPHLYLSPQQTTALQQQLINPTINPYKSDIWTLGMIMLEAGLLEYQDQCYRDQLSRIHWETLQYNINRLGQAYSEQMKNMIEFMLSRDQRARQDWLDLQQHVMKSDQGKRSFIQDQTIQIDRGSFVNNNNKTQPQILNNRLPTTPHQQINQQPRVSTGLSNAHNPIYFDNHRPSTYSPRNGAAFNQLPIQYQHGNYMPPTSSRNPTNLRPPSLGQAMGPSLGAIPDSNTISPIKISMIDQSRPLRNIFPVDNYVIKTKVDENLILVEQDDENQSSRGFNQSPTYTQTNYAKPFNMVHRQSQKQKSAKTNQNSNYTRFQSQSTHNAYNNPEPRSSNSQNLNSDQQFVVENFKKGSRYQGYKKDGMRHGHGKFFYQDGGMYDGEWSQNKMNGYGKLYYQSGKLAYEGYWKADQFTGNGVLYNQIPDILDGMFDYRNMEQVEDFWVKYQGQFADDMKNGHGILYLSNGQKFQGNFISDSIQGTGIYYRKNGQQIKARWQNNILRQ